MVFVSVLFVVPCWARVITVDDDGLADFSNIQAAIDDCVVVLPGTFACFGDWKEPKITEQ